MVALRELVIHGLTVPEGAGAGTPGEVDGTAGYKLVLPVASGEFSNAGNFQFSQFLTAADFAHDAPGTTVSGSAAATWGCSDNEDDDGITGRRSQPLARREERFIDNRANINAPAASDRQVRGRLPAWSECGVNQ